MIFPSYYLHTIVCSCQCIYLYQSKFLTRRILLYFVCCDQHGYHIMLVTFLIRSFYNNFKNNIRNFRGFKHIIILFKINSFKIKPLNIRLITPSIWNIVQKDFVQFHLFNIITYLPLRKGIQVFIKIDHRSSAETYFLIVHFPHSAAHCKILFGQCIHRKKSM